MPNGHTDAERLTAVEVELREIKTNHLPHIEVAILNLTNATTKKHDEFNDKLGKMKTLLISGLITLIFVLLGTIINILI